MPSDAITDSPVATRRRWPAPVAVVAFVAVGAAAVGWFLWPALSGNNGDVAMITDPAHEAVRTPLVKEVRERGRDMTDLGDVADWCTFAQDAPTVPLADDVEFLVVAITSRGDCDGDPYASVVAALDRRSVDAVIVVPPGQSPPDVDARMVPVEALLGPPTAQTAPCEWWDVCAPGESVVVRSADGQLTAVGGDRVARMVAATIG